MNSLNFNIIRGDDCPKKQNKLIIKTFEKVGLDQITIEKDKLKLELYPNISFLNSVCISNIIGEDFYNINLKEEKRTYNNFSGSRKFYLSKKNITERYGKELINHIIEGKSLIPNMKVLDLTKYTIFVQIPKIFNTDDYIEEESLLLEACSFNCKELHKRFNKKNIFYNHEKIENRKIINDLDPKKILDKIYINGFRKSVLSIYKKDHENHKFSLNNNFFFRENLLEGWLRSGSFLNDQKNNDSIFYEISNIIDENNDNRRSLLVWSRSNYWNLVKYALDIMILEQELINKIDIKLNFLDFDLLKNSLHKENPPVFCLQYTVNKNSEIKIIEGEKLSFKINDLNSFTEFIKNDFIINKYFIKEDHILVIYQWKR